MSDQLTASRGGMVGRSYRLSPLPQRPITLQSNLAEVLILESSVADILEYSLAVQGVVRG